MPQTETAVTYSESAGSYQTTIPKPHGDQLALAGRYLEWTAIAVDAFQVTARDDAGERDDLTTAVNQRANGQYGTTVPLAFATGADRGRGLHRVRWTIAGADTLEVRKVA